MRSTNRRLCGCFSVAAVTLMLVAAVTGAHVRGRPAVSAMIQESTKSSPAVKPPDLQGTSDDQQPRYNFNFEDSSIYGPKHWDNFSPDCSASTKNQSPINIDASRVARVKPGDSSTDLLEFVYSPCRNAVLRSDVLGASVLCKGTPSKIRFELKDFALKQIRIRAAGEHQFGGNVADGEIHLVHRSPLDDSLAIVVILLDAERDIPSPFLESLWPTLLSLNGTEHQAPLPAPVDPFALLPDTLSFFYYTGSLTTPPCTPGVSWILMETPMKATHKQLAYLRHLSDSTGGVNARDVMPVGDRVVYYYKAPNANTTATPGAGLPGNLVRPEEELEEVPTAFADQGIFSTSSGSGAAASSTSSRSNGGATTGDVTQGKPVSAISALSHVRQKVQAQTHHEKVAWETIKDLRDERNVAFAKSADELAADAQRAEEEDKRIEEENERKNDVAEMPLIRDGQNSTYRVPVIDVEFMSGETVLHAEDLAHIFSIDKNRLFLMRVRNDYSMGTQGHEIWQYQFKVLGATLPGEETSSDAEQRIMAMNGTTSMTSNTHSKLGITVNVCPSNQEGQVCNLHGSCIRNDTCSCDVGYYSFNCDKASTAAEKYPDVLDIVDQVVENLHYEHANHQGLVMRETKIIKDKLDETQQDIDRLRVMMEALGPESAWGDTEQQIGIQMAMDKQDFNKKKAFAAPKQPNQGGGMMTQLEETLAKLGGDLDSPDGDAPAASTAGAGGGAAGAATQHRLPQEPMALQGGGSKPAKASAIMSLLEGSLAGMKSGSELGSVKGLLASLMESTKSGGEL